MRIEGGKDTFSWKHTKIFISMFMAVLFLTAPRWKWPKCPLSVGWINTLRYTDTVKYYTAMGMNRQQLQGWISQIQYWAKKARHKRVHTGWFHIYNVQKQAKPIFVLDVRIKSILGVGWEWKGIKGNLGVLIMFCFLIKVLVIQVCSLWKFSNRYRFLAYALLCMYTRLNTVPIK